jgi:hypothetical protein
MRRMIALAFSLAASAADSFGSGIVAATVFFAVFRFMGDIGFRCIIDSDACYWSSCSCLNTLECQCINAAF